MEQLNDLFVPLNRAQIHEHTQMKGVIGSAGGFLTPPARLKPSEIALLFAQANRQWVTGPYALPASQHNTAAHALVLSTSVSRSPVGYHVQLQQSYQGIPIHTGSATVHMTRERSVYLYTSDLYPHLPSVEAGKAGGLSAQEALEALGVVLPWQGRAQLRPQCSRVYLPYGDALRLVWCIDLSLSAKTPIETETDRSADWRAFVDIYGGQVLQLLDTSLYGGTWGRVFYPNPVVSLQDEELAWQAQIPASAYRRVRLAHVDPSGYLAGVYADTGATASRVFQPDGLFLYERGQTGFLEVMAYCFVSRVMAWLLREGWPGLFSQPLRINVQAPVGDHSKFLPQSWEMHLGTGGVMDAEDASIIIHELGHAIQEAQVKGWGSCAQDMPIRAMGQGFGDWLATLYFAKARRKFHPTYVGDWDARGYIPPSHYLRRVDMAKTMDDWQGQEHADGEIWSAALWELYLRLGGDSASAATRREARCTALQLVLTSHLYLSDGRRETLTYQHGLAALLDADRFTSAEVTKPGPRAELIRDVFARRGIEAQPA